MFLYGANEGVGILGIAFAIIIAVVVLCVL